MDNNDRSFAYLLIVAGKHAEEIFKCSASARDGGAQCAKRRMLESVKQFADLQDRPYKLYKEVE